MLYYMYMSKCNRQVVWTAGFYCPSLKKNRKYFHVCAIFSFIAPTSYLEGKRGVNLQTLTGGLSFQLVPTVISLL